MSSQPVRAVPSPGGAVALGGRRIARLGYGAMQLERVDQTVASRVLRRAVELGVDHVDTASFYGRATVNERIRAALAPYDENLAIVSKVGARRDDDGALVAAQRPAQLREQVELDLVTLGVDRLAAVNLRRLDAPPGIVAEGEDVVPLDDQLAELVALREEGLIDAIGLSNVSADQLTAALPAGIACVQNSYSLLDRAARPTLDICREHDITWVPFCPLGSAFAHLPKPADHPDVVRVATDCGATSSQVALAWLLARVERGALVPGTRSVEHLEENLAAGDVDLTEAQLRILDAIT